MELDRERRCGTSTVYGFKKAYLKKSQNAEPIIRLEHGLCGCPLLLEDLDSNVQKYVRKLRLAGGDSLL